MDIIVVGCGRVGAELAYRLYQKGHQVVVIDQVATAFENLPPDFRGRTVEGEALNQDVLSRAGIEQADGLAAVTNSDSINAVIAHVARATYHVPNVVVRDYDPGWRPLYEAFGLQVVSSTSWGAQRLEELLYQTSMRTVLSVGHGEVGIYEFTVPEAWCGRSLQDLLSVGQCLPVALTRAGRAMLPSSDTRLEAGDVVHLSTTLEGFEALRDRINRLQEG
jgi:trk system potassium uptake protein TrkA